MKISPAPLRSLLALITAACALLLVAARGVVFDTLAHAPGPRPTAAEVLDGRIPGRPAAPALPPDAVPDRAGLDQAKFYHVPAAGEHPRLLFSRADLPRIKQQLEATPTGRALWQDWRKRAAADAADKTGWLAAAYGALAKGDLAAFDALWRDPRNGLRTGPPGAGANPLAQLLFYRSFAALLDADQARGTELAQAVATYAAWLRPQLEAAARQPGQENFWLQLRPVAGDSAVLAFLYDFTQPFMNPAQTETVRGVLAFITRDRYGLGMDLPAHWRNWNFIGMGLYYPHYALAIEGEPGFDRRVVDRGAEVARDYILHSITAHGLGKEGMGYHTAGMGHTSVLMLALANRGQELFSQPRYRAMFTQWMLWTMQPYGGAWSTNGDLGTFPPSVPLVRLARALYPDDPAVALVARQASPLETLATTAPEQSLLELLFPVELGQDRKTKTVPAFPAGLPLSLYDAERGVLFARTGWRDTDLALQVNARSDTTFPSHDHADRGDFFLTALGQAWSVPAMRETGSEHHSIITIDDQGQGFFATPARWLDVTESAAGVTAAIDLAYCYNWRWMKSSFLATDEQLAQEPWLAWVREPRDRLLARVPRDQWERDPSPQVRAYYEPWLAGDPRGWGVEDAWVLRAPYNPVKKAFRAIAMVRGAHPFVVIADDIRKDDQEHLYQWRMIVPMTVEAGVLQGADVVLTPVAARHDPKLRGDSPFKDVGRPLPEPGTPQLLVRILSLARPTEVERTPAPAVETVEFVKSDDVHQFAGRSMGMGKRLVLPSRSVEPRYRVLLFPHRAGEPLPTTKWESPDVLAVTAAGTTTRVRFSDQPDGSTRLTILP